MPKWNNTIDVSSFYHNDELTIPEKGVLISSAIQRAVKDYEDTDKYGFEILDVVEQFKEITGYEDVTEEEEFNEIMSGFYDFCDCFRIWVKTK